VKVVVAHNRYSSASPSGENAVVDAETRLLRDAGVEVVAFQRSSDEIASLPVAEKAALPLSPVYARRAQRELAALLRAERPDVVHLHNPYPLLSPWVVRTAHAHGVPVVQTVHNYRHVCMAGIYFRDGHDCRDCLHAGTPAPGVRHRCYRGSAAQSAVMATALTVHRGTWRGVDRYLALTPPIAEHLRSLGIREEQITVKPNCVPDPGPVPRPGSGFCSVGRLTAEKGVPELLAAWARHPVGSLGTLTVAGDGPLRGEVERAAALRDDLVFLGRLDPAGVRRVLREAAVLVVPSRWDEVCPMVVLEALAGSRPVLAADRGGLPYLVGPADPALGPDGAAGWVVEPSVDALAAALPRAAAEAPALCGAARQRWETTFSPEVVVRALVGVYEELARAGARVPGRPDVSN